MNKDEDQPEVVNSAPVAVVEPAATTDTAAAKPAENTPGVIILQWLSYAFWGWLILALIWLMSVIFVNAILGESVSDTIPYAIAAGVVLLPIAFLTDFFYRKHEPSKKVGVAMVIMVIHAVLFALLAIIALISTVFNSLSALIETSSNVDNQLVVIFTSAGATLLYAATFIRTLNPFKTKKPIYIYSFAMVAITVSLLVLAVVGPLVQTFATKDDRRLEQNLSSVSRGVNEYIQTNEKLPANLDEVNFSDEEADQLVQDGLVVYKAGTGIVSSYRSDQIEYRYQLCATFKEKDSSSYSSPSSDEYSSYLSTSGHGKGQVCYKLSETITQTNTSSSGVQLKEIVLN